MTDRLADDMDDDALLAAATGLGAAANVVSNPDSSPEEREVAENLAAGWANKLK